MLPRRRGTSAREGMSPPTKYPNQPPLPPRSPPVPIHDVPSPCIVEMKGATRFAAIVQEGSMHGVRGALCTLLTDPPRRQLVPPTSVYRITECAEEEARRVGSLNALPPEIQPRVPASAVLDGKTIEIRPTLLAFAARMEAQLRIRDLRTAGYEVRAPISVANLLDHLSASIYGVRASEAAGDATTVTNTCVDIAVAAVVLDALAGDSGLVVTGDLPRLPDSAG